ncbi:eukaryotic translation initiation factor 2D-like isoform X2 [Adelges cooleyi]|nr:eukaryotic translation initiation factor 2D-like isoform X2 [Adelges cooleyi]
MKIITHNNNVVKLYCAQDIAIVFESKGKLYPTVFMVLIYSQIVPRLIINENTKPNFHDSVEIKYSNIFCEENNELLTLLSIDQCVSVYSTLSKKIIGVGHKNVNKSEQNENDKYTINVLHYYDDELFKQFAVSEKTRDTVKAMRKEINKILKLNKNLENLSESSNEVSVEKMDQIVLTCFLKALKKFVKEDMLPLLASEFYRKYVIPLDPEGIKIDFKKTSYKKLSNFLQLLEEKGFIKCTKDIVIDINYNSILKEIDLQHDLEINDLPEDKETTNEDNLCFLPNQNEITCSIPDMEIAYDNDTTIDIALHFIKNDKKITLVSSLEVYGVNIGKFKEKCQDCVAASITINNFPSKENRQVQIQGCHVLFVFKLLTEHYKIPTKYVRGHEGYIRCATLVVLKLPYHFNEYDLNNILDNLAIFS